MAYETLLTVTPVLCAATGYSYSSATTGVSASVVIDITNTTLGSSLSDEYLVLNLATGLGTANLSLSSATSIPSTIVYSGSIVSSTFNTTLSTVQLSINFPVANDADNVNLLNTVLYLSGNNATIGLDTTQTSKLDNFFFVSTNPGENSLNSSNAVRTTFGHSRLVAYRG